MSDKTSKQKTAEPAKEKKQATKHADAKPKAHDAKAAPHADAKQKKVEVQAEIHKAAEAKPEGAKANAEEKAPAGGFRGQKKASAKKEEKNEKKVLEERIYTIPFDSVMRATRKKRANKAVRVVKKFISRHMHSDNVKISSALNEQIWSRGIQKPPKKLRVKALKYEDSVVAELMA